METVLHGPQGRLGVRPLNCETIMVLLTAVHVHYAGFVSPLLTGLAGRDIRLVRDITSPQSLTARV
jgi:hypothetical protein